MGKLKDLQAKVFAKITTEAMSIEWSKKEKALLTGAAGCTMALGSAGSCYAGSNSNTNIENKVDDLLRDGYQIIFGISTGIAILFIAWHLICMMMSGDPQTTRGHVQSIKKTAIAWVLLNCLGLIYNTVKDLTTGNNVDTSLF